MLQKSPTLHTIMFEALTRDCMALFEVSCRHPLTYYLLLLRHEYKIVIMFR